MGTSTSRILSASRQEVLPPAEIIFGHSEAMQLIRQRLERVASAGVPILIQGDNGTGKGVLAQYIHEVASPNAPFVKVNCAAIPGALLESELFGYEKGAFTGAYSSKPGRVERANEGTLFLDGIDEIELPLQAKLLQLLQDGQFSRIGGQEDKQVRIRIVCATNHSLEREVAAGNFRQDLYYRINVVNLQLPPLRNRSTDIPDLVSYFLISHQRRHNVQTRTLSQGVLHLLRRHVWPGNIRELENLIERYVILGTEESISSELLNYGHSPVEMDLSTGGPIHLKRVTRQAVRDLERKIILNVLEANRWNRKRTASALRISYRALLYKIRQAGLPAKRAIQQPTVQVQQPVTPVE